MEKNIVGDWGCELDKPEYARALAALGVLEASGTHQHEATDDPIEVLKALRQEFQSGERTVVWRDAYEAIDNQTPESWRETIHENPGALAAGWRLLLEETDDPRRRPRLALNAGWRRRPDLVEIDALMGWLGSRDTGCQALVLVPEDAREVECRTLWHWPLHIGVPAGAEGQALLDYLRGLKNGWIEKLGILQPVGEARDACDLLLLPTGMAARLAEKPRLRLQASFIACLDDPVPWSAAVDTPHYRLPAKMGAAGIACAGKSLDLGRWYEMLMRGLSHDLPVPAAVWGFDLPQYAFLALVMGEPEALDQLRIAAVGDRIDRKLEMMIPPPKPIPELSGDWLRFEVSFPCEDKPSRARRLAPSKGLGTEIRSRPFSHETVDGLPIAAAIADKTTELEENRVLRYIQAQAWRQDAGAEPALALAPDRASLLTVHIGPSAEPQKEVFPESQFDFSTGPVTLSVQVEIDGAALVALGEEKVHWCGRSWANQRDYLFLRLNELITSPEPRTPGQMLVGVAIDSIRLPLAGDSSRAVFGIWPQPGMDEVAGRIAIVHQNRIVQTAHLTASVGKPTDVGSGVAVVPEAVIHPRQDDLAERRKFDVALIAADDLGSRLRLTVNSDGAVQEIELEDLKSAVKRIYTAVCEVTRRPGDENTLALDSDTMRLVLRSLASQGRLLYDALHDKLGDKLSDIERFQLVSFGKAFFPLEYVYDGPPLKLKAKVCPNSVEAVRRGDCGDCAHQGLTDILCPLRFWGLTKVIERRNDLRVSPPAGEAGTVGRAQLPSPTRSPFGPVKPVLFGASNRAFAFVDGTSWRQQLLQALTLLGDAPPTEAKTWDAWRDGVRDSQPKVLVLLPHTDTVDLGVDVLGIEKEEFLAKEEIDKDLVGVPETVQLLLLLGCAAAQVTETFDPYPERFRRAGADVIIAPLAPILGADAAPIAKRIAELMAAGLSQGREVAFGELLRDLRRELLAEGHPGVLGLVGFGDADWVFGG